MQLYYEWEVWAVESWMSIKEYQDLSIGGTDTKQDLYNKDTSPAVKKLCSAWNITAEQAIEMLKIMQTMRKLYM